MGTEDLHKDQQSKGDPEEERLRSLLHGHDQQSFKVPEGYFEDFQAKIENRISEVAPVTDQKHGRIIKIWVWASVAAIFAGLLAFYIFISNEGSRRPKDQLSQITKMKVEITDTGKDTLDSLKMNNNIQAQRNIPHFKTVAPKTIVKEKLQKSEPNSKIEEATNEDIIEYLLDEDFDISDLSN